MRVPARCAVSGTRVILPWNYQQTDTRQSPGRGPETTWTQDTRKRRELDGDALDGIDDSSGVSLRKRKLR